MKKWTESSLLTKLNHPIRDEWSKQHISISKMLVTLKLLDIYNEKLLIEKLSPPIWRHTANYIMGRKNY